ncbi:hypothetical protein CDLVIII_1048 [Clostridium sp. DL-VIII]|nr:hypothetical protein [Clostridium sp. DL-VIII]EHI97751.1 hypothetical protein CDLVIII_1048 [Clostridium sp. DL-VIII]
MKDKLTTYELVSCRFMLGISEHMEKFMKRYILSCKRGEFFEN